MTGFAAFKLLTEKGCSGNCEQGRKPCDCKEPIPFAGWIQHSDDTVTRIIPKGVGIDRAAGETAKEFIVRVDRETRAQVDASEARLSWWFKLWRRVFL